MQDTLERIESIKAGSLGALAAGIGYGSISLGERLLLHSWRSWLSLGLELGIAICCGFLFAVTYRYIIRTDRNDHLNSGAVLAFGLVRGLAQIDPTEFGLDRLWIDGAIVGKSILLFAIARYALDFGLRAGWILPFGQRLECGETAAALAMTTDVRSRSAANAQQLSGKINS